MSFRLMAAVFFGVASLTGGGFGAYRTFGSGAPTPPPNFRSSGDPVEDAVRVAAYTLEKKRGERTGSFSNTVHDGASSQGRVLYMAVKIPGEAPRNVASAGMEVRRKLATGFCSNSQVKDLLMRGAAVDIAYRSDSGATFFSTRLDRSACT